MILVPQQAGKSALEIPVGEQGEVWSCSDTCVNIKFGSRLLGLVWNYEQMAPANILFSFPVNFARGKCVRTTHGLTISAQTVSFKSAPVFSGEILPSKINISTVEKVQSLLNKKTETYFSQELKKNAARGNWENLIGLGPGSTPSGDDFLCGAFAADKLLNIKREIAIEISKVISPKMTTLHGYTMLTDSLAGGFPFILQKMVRELACDFFHEFWYNLINNSSHHSPADFCAGLMWELNHLLEKT